MIADRQAQFDDLARSARSGGSAAPTTSPAAVEYLIKARPYVTGTILPVDGG